MIAGAERIALRIEEGHDAALLVVVQHCPGDWRGGCHEQARNQELPESEARDEEDDGTHGDHQHRRSEVGLL